MESVKNILVCLDKTAMNETIIKFAEFIANNSVIERVNFVNVVKNLDIPKEVIKEFPDLKKNALKERKELITQDVEKWFNPKREVKKAFTIIPGREAKAILEISEKEQSDMILIGRKKDTESEGGVLATRLARRAGCSLWIIPEHSQPKLDKVLLPVDFSEYSRLAMERSIDFAVKGKLAMEIIAQNVYNVPTGYHYSGKSYNEFATIMEKYAKADYEKFIKKIDTQGVKIKAIFDLDVNENIISDIIDKSSEYNPNCIIVGAKGRTKTTALFLGSFAEKLISAEMPVPLLIVRPRGKKEGFMDYLKEISR